MMMPGKDLSIPRSDVCVQEDPRREPREFMRLHWAGGMAQSPLPSDPAAGLSEQARDWLTALQDMSAWSEEHPCAALMGEIARLCLEVLGMSDVQVMVADAEAGRDGLVDVPSDMGKVLVVGRDKTVQPHRVFASLVNGGSRQVAPGPTCAESLPLLIVAISAALGRRDPQDSVEAMSGAFNGQDLLQRVVARLAASPERCERLAQSLPLTRKTAMQWICRPMTMTVTIDADPSVKGWGAKPAHVSPSSPSPPAVPKALKEFRLKYGTPYEACDQRLVALFIPLLQNSMPKGRRLEVLEWQGAFAAKLHRDVGPGRSLASDTDTDTTDSDSDDHGLFKWTGFGIAAFFATVSRVLREDRRTSEAVRKQTGGNVTADELQRWAERAERAATDDPDRRRAGADCAPKNSQAYVYRSWSDTRVPSGKEWS